MGWSTGTVSDSNTSGSITSVSAHGRNTAGLVGRNEGTVTRSSSNATVKDRFGACGLVGDNYGTVRFSSATGPASISDQLKGENPYGAGLVCGNFGTINQSFATGAVQGGFGREGEIHTFYAPTCGLGSYNQGGLIEDSYAFGAVNADGQPGLEYTGGLAGRATGGTIATSYSTGLIASPDTFGGLIGWGESNNAQSDTYWDLDTSGVSDPSKGQGNVANEPGIKGLTDAKLKSGLPAGFDPAIWGQSASINNGYPYLLANPPP